MTVRAETIPETVDLPGTVRAVVISTLSSKVLGRITAVHVREGDLVRKGQVLVEVDARQVEAGIRQAEASLEQARFAAQQAREAVRVAKADLQAAEADLGLARVTFERFKALFDRQSVSAQEFDQVAARHKAALAHVKKARRAVRAARAGRERAVAAQEAAQAALEAAKSLWDYTRIASPVDGVVTAKLAEVGQMAAPGVALVTVEDTRRYRLEVDVPESVLPFVHRGDPVPVFFAQARQPFMGRVSEIVPAVDAASRTARVKIDLAERDVAKGPGDEEEGKQGNARGEGDKGQGSPAKGAHGSASVLGPSDLLRSGAFARARFRLGKRSVIRVPREAVYERGQLTGVFVVDDEQTVHRRLVRLGRDLDGTVEVLSGLEAGERIAARIVPGLVDGARLVGN